DPGNLVIVGSRFPSAARSTCVNGAGQDRWSPTTDYSFSPGVEVVSGATPRAYGGVITSGGAALLVVCPDVANSPDYDVIREWDTSLWGELPLGQTFLDLPNRQLHVISRSPVAADSAPWRAVDIDTGEVTLLSPTTPGGSRVLDVVKIGGGKALATFFPTGSSHQPAVCLLDYVAGTSNVLMTASYNDRAWVTTPLESDSSALLFGPKYVRRFNIATGDFTEIATLGTGTSSALVAQVPSLDRSYVAYTPPGTRQVVKRRTGAAWDDGPVWSTSTSFLPNSPNNVGGTSFILPGGELMVVSTSSGMAAFDTRGDDAAPAIAWTQTGTGGFAAVGWGRILS
ncbi:hypothetical protein, partial [uncultured Reyranella sp.]|uniref:hypothetical protein n=1 Tax=uncultured Reyranella sp. TaxID=735512 RepID=UPI00259CA849